MYRFFTILFVLTILFNVSCIRRSPFNIFNDDQKTAANRFEAILSTLENNDMDSLKSMFSINVLKESEMMDENIGLYTLRVINEEEKEMQWGFWQDMVQPGIYNPSN